MAYIWGGRWGRGLALSCTAGPQMLPTTETIPGEPCPGYWSGPAVLPLFQGRHWSVCSETRLQPDLGSEPNVLEQVLQLL